MCVVLSVYVCACIHVSVCVPVHTFVCRSRHDTENSFCLLVMLGWEGTVGKYLGDTWYHDRGQEEL